MTTLDEKPFRSENEPEGGPAEARIRMGHPSVRPHVVPIKADPAAHEPTKGDFVTSFLVTWKPEPVPPAHWVELLREAPFGTQGVRSRDLHWDGHVFSIELVNESDIEAFAVEMPDWVAFANTEFGRRRITPGTPAEEALAEAARRAAALEKRLRGTEH
jgi:hypothetical protein